MDHRRVAYVWSEELQNAADELPSNIGRSSVVHGLIQALDLLHDDQYRDDSFSGPQGGHKRRRSPGLDPSSGRRKAWVIPPDHQLGSRDSLKRYHDENYVGTSMSGVCARSSSSQDRVPHEPNRA
jgi:hypothetical protein